MFDGIVLWAGGRTCPVHCRMFDSCHWPLPCREPTPNPVVTDQNVSRHCQVSPCAEGARLPLVEIHWLSPTPADLWQTLPGDSATVLEYTLWWGRRAAWHGSFLWFSNWSYSGWTSLSRGSYLDHHRVHLCVEDELFFCRQWQIPQWCYPPVCVRTPGKPRSSFPKGCLPRWNLGRPSVGRMLERQQVRWAERGGVWKGTGALYPLRAAVLVSVHLCAF